MEFAIYFINFQNKKKSSDTFNYNCCLQSVYMINEDKTQFTPQRRK